MAKTSIWMPLYIGDYIADTMHLTCEQHGAYLLLMMAYWRKGGPLPSNDASLSAICRLSLDAWSIHKAVLMEFFDTSKGGVWIHGRIEKELSESIDKKEKAAEKARKAAEERWRLERIKAENATSTEQALLDDCPSPSPSPSPTKKPKENRSGSGTRLPADWELTDELKAIAKQIRPEWPDNHVQRIADGFKDYWLAKSGKDATKADWLATWRNWCRNDRTQITGAFGNGQHQNPFGGNSGKGGNRSGGSAFDKVINEINAARQRDNREPMGNHGPAVRPQVDQQLWGGTGPDGSMGGVIEGDFTRDD